MRLVALVICGFGALTIGALAVAQSSPPALRSPAAFDAISDRATRSRAIFGEIGKVLTHPRCMNCHPAGNHPLQGADHREHQPPVQRPSATYFGPDCGTCHTDHNVRILASTTFQSIPGHPRWGLAPLSMAWEGKSLREICTQIKDTNRNGGRNLALLQEHVAKDDLVAWGWNPGEGREPAPGNQKLAGELMQAWIDSGAECP